MSNLSASVLLFAFLIAMLMSPQSKTKYALKLHSPKTPIPPTSGMGALSPDDYLLTCKGAPDVLMKRCATVLDPISGASLSLNSDTISRITNTQEDWAMRGQRVILLARRIISKKEMDYIDSVCRSVLGSIILTFTEVHRTRNARICRRCI
jgi:magnesium-transporting ATPase (P-type)